MGFLFFGHIGQDAVPWTVYGIGLAGLVLLAIASAVAAVKWSEPKITGRTLSAIAVLLGAVVAFVTSLFTSHWINDHEFGLSQRALYTTGVYPLPLEGVVQIPRTDGISLIDAQNIGAVTLEWVVEDPEKLVGHYRDMNAFRGSRGDSLQGDSQMFRNWVTSLLIPVTPKAREILLPVEESATLNADFIRQLDQILKIYGIRGRVFVTKRYVLAAGDGFLE